MSDCSSDRMVCLEEVGPSSHSSRLPGLGRPILAASLQDTRLLAIRVGLLAAVTVPLMMRVTLVCPSAPSTLTIFALYRSVRQQQGIASSPPGRPYSPDSRCLLPSRIGLAAGQRGGKEVG